MKLTMPAAYGGSRLLLFLGTVFLTGDFSQAQNNKAQLKVVEHIWGYDGRVQPGQFNPLSVLLDNQTTEPVDATAVLQRVQGLMNETGGRIAQPVFIAPAARRWIQFYPYISDPQQCEWRLRLLDNHGGQKPVTFEFVQPRPSWKTMMDEKEQLPQMVILDPAGRRTNNPSTVKHMPENIFPPYSTVTFGLQSVFLDHVPDWELPRQNAFMGWLRQGGQLHLLQGIRGEFPVFSGPLVDLNQPQNTFRVGQGLVQRHDIQRSALTKSIVRRAAAERDPEDEQDAIDEIVEQRAAQAGFAGAQMVETDAGAIDDSFFRGMRELTMPEHAWWLIFLLALCYIGLIFPGCFFLSKQKQRHFLTTYGAIVGLSIVFSGIFLLIGRRGYGETTNLQSLALARAETDRTWNVFEWGGLFVTAGDRYTIGAEEQQAMLSTGDMMNRQDAVISTGQNAQMEVRIAPFSSQTFLSRRVLKTADWQLQLKSLDMGAGDLVDLEIQAGPNLPRSEDTKYLVLVGRDVWDLVLNRSTNTLSQLGQRRPLALLCQPVYSQDFSSPWGRSPQSDAVSQQDQFYADAFRQLVQRSLIDDLERQPVRFRLPSDRIRLMVYTEMPESMYASVSADAKRSGRILFIKDLFLDSLSTSSQSPPTQPNAGN